jgi:hypothetical protein
MDLITGLQDLNLSEREARVYLALLEMETGTPLSIANVTDLKRPTVYLVLESLRRKRLAGLTFKGKKTYYTAEPPSRFLRYLDEDRQTALKLLPLLKAVAQPTDNKPMVRYYDHQEDMENVWYEAASSTKYYDYISNSSKYVARFKDMVDFNTACLKSGSMVRMRGLNFFDRANIPYIKNNQQTKRQIRILPKGCQVNYNVTIWNNNIALYSFEHHYLLVITDNTLTEVFRSLFDIAWDASMLPAEFFKKCDQSTKPRRVTHK